MPPKGWRKPVKTEPTDKPVPVHAPNLTLVPVIVPEPPKDFQIGQWYAPTDQQPVATDSMGRVFKWSVIRFEVIRITDGILAVRFEDGTFEAMVNPEFEKFRPVMAPRY